MAWSDKLRVWEDYQHFLATKEADKAINKAGKTNIQEGTSVPLLATTEDQKVKETGTEKPTARDGLVSIRGLERRFYHSTRLWKWDRFTQLLVLQGNGPWGKTQRVLSLFITPLHVTRMAHLTEFDPKIHDGVILDGITFFGDSKDACLRFADLTQDIILNGTKIPAHTPRVVVGRMYPFNKYPGLPLYKRICPVVLYKDLRDMRAWKPVVAGNKGW